jgi:hypothetical protein
MTRQISLISLLPFYLGSWGKYVRFNKRISAYFFVVSGIRSSLLLINLQYNIFRPNFFQNPDKSLKSFPPCYSQLSLTVSTVTVQLLYTVKEKGGNPDRKSYPLPYGLRNPY